jgi:hypothetical protein
MNNLHHHLRASALLMRVIGWAILIGAPILVLSYLPGFMWGEHATDFPRLGPAHPPSHLLGPHPYLYMIFSLYIGWAILLIRGASDPKAAASLFDWGIYANGLHAVIMIPMAFFYPNEHAHLWADIPLQLAISAVMWYWHPNRQLSVETKK